MASIVERRGRFCVVYSYKDKNGKRRQKYQIYFNKRSRWDHGLINQKSSRIMQCGKIVKYGIAFAGKNVEIAIGFPK